MLNTPSRQRGFNIVELMVAITLGLIVSIAVISFLASTIESTNAAMRATRLNQELRSLAEVIAREIRRARATTDPLANIGSGCDRGATVSTADDCSGLDVMTGLSLEVPDAVDTTLFKCVRFGYQGAPGGNFRAIRLSNTGSVILGRGTRDDTECSDPGTTISSDVVNITALTFQRVQLAAGPPAVFSPNGINITLSGRLRNGPAGAEFEKTYQTTVFIRSGGF